MSLIRVDQKKLYDFKKSEAVLARQRAYTREADPIAAQMLRDEATRDEWLAKIEEIKARYPYPEEQP